MLTIVTVLIAIAFLMLSCFLESQRPEESHSKGPAGRLCRLDRDTFQLAMVPGEVMLPDKLKLRPAHQSTSSPPVHHISDKSGDRERGELEGELGHVVAGMSGNFIANFKETEMNFNKCVKEHLAQEPSCEGIVRFDSNRYIKRGLGIRSGLRCTVCDYKSTGIMAFYEEVVQKDESKGRQGRPAAKLNVQLQVALTKTPIGNSAFRNILSTLDIDPPSERGMQDVANRVSREFTKLNEDQLAQNREKVGTIMGIRQNATSECQAKILVEADAAYNNPPKGRSFSQPGTQSWMPMFCGEKGLEVPVAFATKSKLCPKCKWGKDCHDPSCTKDFQKNVAMGQAEKDMGRDCAEQVFQNKTLKIGALVADGDSHIAQGVGEAGGEDVERQLCSRHLTKSVGRNLNKDELKSVQGATKAATNKNRRDLASFAQKRCAWEFKEAHKKCGNDVTKLVELCDKLKRGVISCIKGDGDACRRISLVCKAHRRGKGMGKKSGVSVRL